MATKITATCGALLCLTLAARWAAADGAAGEGAADDPGWSGYTDAVLQRIELRAAERRAGLGGIALVGVR